MSAKGGVFGENKVINFEVIKAGLSYFRERKVNAKNGRAKKREWIKILNKEKKRWQSFCLERQKLKKKKKTINLLRLE
jgi:hypothetical protein